LYNQIKLINSYLNFNFILKEFLNQKQDIHWLILFKLYEIYIIILANEILV
jgi:hypothetical protein